MQTTSNPFDPVQRALDQRLTLLETEIGVLQSKITATVSKAVALPISPQKITVVQKNVKMIFFMMLTA